MRSPAPLLRVAGLTIEIPSAGGAVRPVREVSFDLARGETLALVGESGSGKTLTCLALVRLVPEPARVAAGTVELDGVDLGRLDPARLDRVRGGRIGFVFQDPAAALDPLFRVGDQIAEVVARHRGLARGAARAEAVRRMEELEISDAARRFDDYPHQFSGGMQQRIAIAIALAGDPDLLIADEPTTALDVTTARTLLELLARVRRERGLALLLVTHDLALAAGIADRICVMYAGRIVEAGGAAARLERPGHPYTEALIACARSLEEGRGGHLASIAGTVPSPADDPDRCAFAERCPYAIAACRERRPAPVARDAGFALCLRVDRVREAVW